MVPNMREKTASLLVIAVLVSFVFAGEAPTGSLKGRLQLPDKRAFTGTTRISLNHDERHTYTMPDGSFIFFNIEPGVHVVDVFNHNFHFAQIKCQFLEAEMEKPYCTEYIYPGAGEIQAAYPLILTALASVEYFEVKRGFSLLAILKNPMILMMLFSVGMMYFMPKMMEGMDPEEKARFKQQMAMQNDPKKMLGQLFGDIGGEDQKTLKSK